MSGIPAPRVALPVLCQASVREKQCISGAHHLFPAKTSSLMSFYDPPELCLQSICGSATGNMKHLTFTCQASPPKVNPTGPKKRESCCRLHTHGASHPGVQVCKREEPVRLSDLTSRKIAPKMPGEVHAVQFVLAQAGW